MITRARAIVERDVNHIEVANRLQGTNNDFSNLKLLISGDGVGEFALLFLLIFALWTINLPSMKHAPLTVRLSLIHI